MKDKYSGASQLSRRVDNRIHKLFCRLLFPAAFSVNAVSPGVYASSPLRYRHMLEAGEIMIAAIREGNGWTSVTPGAGGCARFTYVSMGLWSPETVKTIYDIQ